MRRYYFFSTLFPLCFAALENGKARKGHEEKRLFPFYPPVCFSPQKKKSSTHLSGLMNYRWQMRYKSFENNTQHKTKALQTTWPWISRAGGLPKRILKLKALGFPSLGTKLPTPQYKMRISSRMVKLSILLPHHHHRFGSRARGVYSSRWPTRFEIDPERPAVKQLPEECAKHHHWSVSSVNN